MIDCRSASMQGQSGRAIHHFEHAQLCLTVNPPFNLETFGGLEKDASDNIWD